MLRSNIVLASHRIASALEEAKIRQGLSTLRRSRPDVMDPTKAITAFQHFSIAAARFGEVEREIIGILGLENLLEPEWWARLLTPGSASETDRNLYSMRSSVEFALEHLPSLMNLLKRDSDPSIEALRDELRPSGEDVSRLILIIPEAHNKLSSPTRVIHALDAINILYVAVADLFETSSSDLAIASCDSGSDKVFDFTGLGEVIEKLKDLIISIWDKVIYFKEHKTKERIDLVARSLPILEHIASLEKEEKITREAAELFRRRIIEGTTKFLETGSTIPEINARAVNEPAKLLQPKEALLLEAPKSSPDAPSGRRSNGQENQSEPKEGSEDGPEGNGLSEPETKLTDEEMAQAIQNFRRDQGKRSSED